MTGQGKLPDVIMTIRMHFVEFRINPGTINYLFTVTMDMPRYCLSYYGKADFAFRPISVCHVVKHDGLPHSNVDSERVYRW